jgi:outer membrane receptor protein involved in Fe transport
VILKGTVNTMDNKYNYPAAPGTPPFTTRQKTLALVVSAVLGTSQGAIAQPGMLEEVIVTASKRKANLQDLPQAITAFTTEDISRQGFTGLDDYAAKIPSLAYATREPAGTSVVFRGVASSGIQFGTNPSSGVYLDEQPITQAGLNPDPRLIDIERVEALSGPQGTLFGDASQSGTLRIITNKPDPNEFDGWIEGTLAQPEHSDDQDTDISGMVNIPLLNNKVGVRLVGFRADEAGYIDNVLGLSQPDQWKEARTEAGLPVRPRFDNKGFAKDDINSSTTTGGRAALRWLVNDDWTVDVAGIIQDLEVDGFGDTTAGLGDLQQLRFADEKLKDKWYQLSLTIEGDLGFADTTLTGSYFNRDMKYDADATSYQHDFDQTYNPVYYAIYDFTGQPRGKARQDQEDDRWTFEGRLATQDDSGSRWSGLVGFFYSKLERKQLFTSDVQDFSDTEYYANQGYSYLTYLANSPYYNPNYDKFHNTPTDNWFFGSYDLEVKQTAVFGEVSFAATDKLTFTAGARWFDYQQDVTLRQGALLGGKTPNLETDYFTTNESPSTTDSDWVPKFNVTYQFNDDMMGYATYSEGFRRGGTNAVRASSVLPRSYDPDKLKNYELGFKSTWFNNSLSWNSVLYRMEWEDMQIQVNDPEIFSLGIVNFSEAQVDGFETEITWVPSDGWDITLNGAWINAEISKNDVITGEDGVIVAEVSNGTQLPISPEYKASIAVQYSFNSQLWGADPYVRVDWSYVGDSVNSLDGTESIVFTQGPTDQPSYDLGNIRAGLDADKWSATLFVDNVTDEVAKQFYNNRWGSLQRISVNQPRTVGVTMRWKF